LRIFIAGTVHADPLCRRELLRWLRERQAAERTPPAFVAVEADPDHFSAIRAQREPFKQIARAAWPELSEDCIGELASTMLFEADAHTESFPDVDVFWMDRGRDLPDADAVSKFAERHLSMFDGLIRLRRSDSGDFEKEHLLRFLSNAMKLGLSNGPPQRTPARDMLWYQGLAQLILRWPENAWGIIVCGVEHTRKANGNVAELLELDGHQVEGVDLVDAI